MGFKERQVERQQARAVAKEAESPRGQARAAWDNGDLVFQFQCAASSAGPALSEVAAEGWRFESVAVGWQPKNAVDFGDVTTTSRGTMVGYYVFVRP